MRQLRLKIFTSKIKIYNLRIVPSPPVFDDIVSFKEQFEILYGKQPLSRSKPQITLAAFNMNSKYQDLMIAALGQLSSVEQFNLGIAGFDVFESSRTLHLKVTKPKALERLHRTIQDLCDAHLQGKLKSLMITNEPHITISRTTGKEMLYDSLGYFQKTGYTKQIEVGQLTLVSRSKYKTWDWEHRINLS